MSILADWFERLRGARATPHGDPAAIAAVEHVLAEQRAWLRDDGGDVVLVGVRDGWVELRFEGACTHCASQTQTLTGLLEPKLVLALPWVRGVRRVS